MSQVERVARLLGIEADPAGLTALADNLALLDRHWRILRGPEEAEEGEA